MRYIIQQTVIVATLLLGGVALVTHEVYAQQVQPDPSTAMRRCDDVMSSGCPPYWEPDERGGADETERVVVYDPSLEKRRGEASGRYKDRIYFVTQFELFVEKSKINLWQVQAILLALYDYQVKESALLKSAREQLQDESYFGSVCAEPSDDGRISGEHYLELREALKRILNWEQFRIWQEFCSRCHSRLGWFHDDPILKLRKSR